jgi:hypothetical protein
MNDDGKFLRMMTFHMVLAAKLEDWAKNEMEKEGWVK